MLHKKLIASLAFISMAVMPSGAAIKLTPASPALSQDFNSMWNADSKEGTLQLPEEWRVDRNLNAPRRIGTWQDAASEVMYQGGISLASNAKNGTWNFGSSDSDRAIGGLSTTVANGTRCVSVMTCVENADPAKIITSLAISYNLEKYRLGANTAGFRVQLYTSRDGAEWESAGDSFMTFFEPDASTVGTETVPTASVAVSDNLRTHVEAGRPLYIAWNISVASGTTPDKAQALAVDDIKISATFADEDPDWEEPTKPAINHSGIYMRGVDGWDPTAEWEFNKLSDTTFELRDKVISGSFKIADASWSATCNYGSNGTNIMMSEPYLLSAGTNDNISCGSNVYSCSRVFLTIENGVATLLLEPDESMEGLGAVYMTGDFNGWDYMNTSGKLTLDESTGVFSGRVTLGAGQDGLSHWRIYQRLGMAGVWGLPADATQASPLSGSLTKGAKGNIATLPGTYDITLRLSTDGNGTYSMTKVESPAVSLEVNPMETILVPKIPEEVKVLSLNNSLIHYNDQSKMFNDIAYSMGKKAEWTKHTLLGKSLATHWDEGDGLAADGLPGARMMVRSQPWTHIILQEQSSLPRTNSRQFRDNVKTWVEYIRENCPNPNAIIILPVNWAYSGDWANFSSFNDIFLRNYEEVADEFGLVICPVMSAYQSRYDEKGPDGLASWFQDDRHPTDLSTYMAACMEYGLIFGEDPASISSHPSSLTDAEAADMRAAASSALRNYSNTVDHNGAKVALKATVEDAFGLTLIPENLTFTLDSDNASVDNNGVFSGSVPGEYTVKVSASGFEKEAVIRIAEHATVMPEIKAINLSADNLSYSQNFDSMGDLPEAAMPEGWRIDRTDTPRAAGDFKTAAECSTYAGGVSLPSNAKNGIWNFGPDSNDRAVGGITTGVAGGARAVNVYARLGNNGKKSISSIDLSYDIEKYRDGNNAAGFSVRLFTSTNGRDWTPAGESFITDFPASPSTAGAEIVPIETRSVAATLDAALDPGCDLYLAWNISVTSGDQCQGAPALAIDNVSMTANLKPVPTFDHYIFIEDTTGYDAMGVYAYGDKEIWGAWPGQAPIDIREIEGVTYKVFGHNEADGSYSLIVNNWNQGSQLSDYAIKGGRDYYFLATPASLTEKTLSGITCDVEDSHHITVMGNEAICPEADCMNVYDVAGVRVASSATHTVSLSGLQKGIYIAEAAGEGFRQVIRFVKR